MHLISPTEVSRKLGGSITLINELEKTADFPKSMQISPRKRRMFVLEEIDAWLQKCAAARPGCGRRVKP